MQILENDPTQKQQYGKVWHYVDWAKDHLEYPFTDTGIDLVTDLKEEKVFVPFSANSINREVR